MQVENIEINGFLIDKFNQHSLSMKVKRRGFVPCVRLLDNLKIRRLKCASYDWERGLGTCHNCDTSFQLHTYQRKGESEKVYTSNLIL